MEAISIKSGAKLVHVPYPSSPAAVTALVRGDVQMVALPAVEVKPQADAGSAKILALSLPKRSPFLPDIPTLIESGVDVEADTWLGLIAPGGMPKPLVETISKDVAKVINSEKVREAFAAQYMEPVGSSPEQFRTVISAEIARWAPIIKAANVPKVN
jgi:tripartite-type tricarboxylate transporter receptor subunit TctC